MQYTPTIVVRNNLFPFGYFEQQPSIDPEDHNQIYVKTTEHYRNQLQYSLIKQKLQILKKISHKNLINLKRIEQVQRGSLSMFYTYVDHSFDMLKGCSSSQMIKSIHKQLIQLIIFLAKHSIITNFSPERCGLKTLPTNGKIIVKYYLPLSEITICNKRSIIERSVNLFTVKSMQCLDEISFGLVAGQDQQQKYEEQYEEGQEVGQQNQQNYYQQGYQQQQQQILPQSSSSQQEENMIYTTNMSISAAAQANLEGNYLKHQPIPQNSTSSQHQNSSSQFYSSKNQSSSNKTTNSRKPRIGDSITSLDRRLSFCQKSKRATSKYHHQQQLRQRQRQQSNRSGTTKHGLRKITGTTLDMSTADLAPANSTYSQQRKLSNRFISELKLLNVPQPNLENQKNIKAKSKQKSKPSYTQSSHKKSQTKKLDQHYCRKQYRSKQQAQPRSNRLRDDYETTNSYYSSVQKYLSIKKQLISKVAKANSRSKKALDRFKQIKRRLKRSLRHQRLRKFTHDEISIQKIAKRQVSSSKNKAKNHNHNQYSKQNQQYVQTG